MEQIIATLIKQAFSAQEDKIANLAKENEKLKEELKELKRKDEAFEELHQLFDNEITKLKDYVKNYIAKEDENFSLMEEYKFGQEER